MSENKVPKRVVKDLHSLHSLIPKAEATAMQATAVAAQPSKVESIPEKKIPATLSTQPSPLPPPEPFSKVETPQQGFKPKTSTKPLSTRITPLETQTTPAVSDKISKKPEKVNSVKNGTPAAAVSAKAVPPPSPPPSTVVKSKSAAVASSTPPEQTSTMSTTSPKKAAPAKAPAVQAPVQLQAAKLNVYIMVSVDLADAVISENCEEFKTLSKFKPDSGGSVVNLFNPFRGLSTKDKEKGLGRGIIRNLLPKALDLAGEVNDSNMMLLGATDVTAQHLSDVGAMLATRLDEAIGIPENILCAVYSTDPDAEEGAEPASTEGLLRKDFVSVNHWINSSGPEHGDGFTHNLVLNIRVRCPNFHASEDPGKVVVGITNAISSIVEARQAEEKTVSPIILGLMLKASDVVDPGFYEMLGVLNDAESGDWVCYDRPDLHALCGDVNCDWVPATTDLVDANLLTARSGIFYITTFPEAEDGEDEDGEESSDDEGTD